MADNNDNPASPEVPSGKKQKKKKTAFDYARAFFIKIGVTAAVIAALLIWVAGVYVCHDNSSYPMIKDGDLCITYKLGSLEQGDAVAYKYGDKIRFGRVIAAGGDEVGIFNDYITVNGSGVFEDVIYPTTPEGSKITYPYKVPENCVFILNDHRTDISDSRTAGGISEDDIKGKIVFVMRRRGI